MTLENTWVSCFELQYFQVLQRFLQRRRGRRRWGVARLGGALHAMVARVGVAGRRDKRLVLLPSEAAGAAALQYILGGGRGRGV